MGATSLRISELCLPFSPHPNNSDGNVNLVHHFSNTNRDLLDFGGVLKLARMPKEGGFPDTYIYTNILNVGSSFWPFYYEQLNIVQRTFDSKVLFLYPLQLGGSGGPTFLGNFGNKLEISRNMSLMKGVGSFLIIS